MESEILFKYTRAEALEDGELVDISNLKEGKPSGLHPFKVPVAFTRSLFLTLEGFNENSGEDLLGRINDVLFMAVLAARNEKNTDKRSKYFQVIITNAQGVKITHELLIDIGPGDEAEPVITIGFPEDF